MNQLTVLDKGFVRLEAVHGSDLMVCNAARVSFGKKSYWQCGCGGVPIDEPCCHQPGDYRLQDADTKLIQYLARNNHWTPFGHPQITLHIKLPIFVARQLMRSNVGICYNEISRRYVDSDPEFYEPKEWRGRPPKSIKQGSEGVVDYVEEMFDLLSGDESAYFTAHDACLAEYKHRLECGVAPEMARIVLPVSIYTEVWMTASLAALARVVNLRSDPHAQWEVVQYANAINLLVEPSFPVSWPALRNS